MGKVFSRMVCSCLFREDKPEPVNYVTPIKTPHEVVDNLKHDELCNPIKYYILTKQKYH